MLVPILSEWINDEDLCYLDTAVCCHKLRNSLVRMMEHCSIITTDMARCDSDFMSFKCWLLLRGLGLKKYRIDWKVSPDEAKLLFKSKRLMYLEGGRCNDLVDFIARIPIKSDRVSVHYCRGDSLKDQ